MEIGRVVVLDVPVDGVVVQDQSGGSHRLRDTDDLIDGSPVIHQLASLTKDDDGVYLLELAEGSAIRCAVKAVGAQLSREIELSAEADRVLLWQGPCEELGLENDEAQQAQTLNFWWVGDLQLGWWDYAGGLDGWRAARLLADETRAVERERKRLAIDQRRVEEEIRGRATDEIEKFVNPYTFVPMPDGDCERRPPVGHLSLRSGGYIGRIDFDIECLTPLLIRGGHNNTMPVNGQGKPIVPGSSLKGALRSLHETMFGGCMRVIDRDFVPGYRDTVQSRGKGWTLVQVEEVEAGRPVRLRKCSRVVWAKATEIQRELGVGDLRSGMTVDVDETRIEEQTDTRHLVQTAGVRTGDGWVMLITDARARNNANTYWCALGKLSEHSQKLSQDAWDRFLASVEGADDLRTAVGELDLDEQKKRMRVRHDYRHGAIDVGFRDLACRELQPGQVLWGRAQDGEVADLALAQVWRHSGEGSVAERLPGFAPCSDPEDLCVSCRLFGSADDRSGGADEPSDGAARQDGYRGHIRFTDAVVVDESPKLERVELAPMGAPRPGAGQFYLRNGDTTAANERKQVPTREWGSAHDGGTPRDYRPIRGRKHYWHADPTLQQTPRHLARDHQSAAMRSEVELLGSGSRLRTRIWFENLDEVALGTLLATLVPERILSDPDEGGQHKRLAWRLGGGKPLGLGSLRVVDMPQLAELHTASSRYGDADPPNLDVNTLIGGARSSVPESVVQTWPDLAAVLQPEHVDPRLVWYPPGDKWQAVGSKSFDDGFEFWKQTSGEFLADDDNQRSLVELPQPRDSWQYLPIKYKSDRTRRR